eukprot:TRINITY_DN1438_c0_g1_i2.p1 TRINITY_DN1438_c0_g1~~TRINITY_DN1438_c0_g1_i2.p1  ORF type:complete len:84 (-),score=2.10 TRINITY_DN1438_c0_g1_i2:29-280(-)
MSAGLCSSSSYYVGSVPFSACARAGWLCSSSFLWRETTTMGEGALLSYFLLTPTQRGGHGVGYPIELDIPGSTRYPVWISIRS